MSQCIRWTRSLKIDSRKHPRADRLWDVFLSFNTAHLQIPEEIYIREDEHENTHDLESHAPTRNETNHSSESEIGDKRDATGWTSDDECPEESSNDTGSRMFARKVRKMDNLVHGCGNKESEKKCDQYLQCEFWDRVLCPEIALRKGKIRKVPKYRSNQGGCNEKNEHTLRSREYFSKISEHTFFIKQFSSYGGLYAHR